MPVNFVLDVCRGLWLAPTASRTGESERTAMPPLAAANALRALRLVIPPDIGASLVVRAPNPGEIETYAGSRTSPLAALTRQRLLGCAAEVCDEVSGCPPVIKVLFARSSTVP
jgi:hypothetical protein